MRAISRNASSASDQLAVIEQVRRLASLGNRLLEVALLVVGRDGQEGRRESQEQDEARMRFIVGKRRAGRDDASNVAFLPPKGMPAQPSSAIWCSISFRRCVALAA